MGDLKLAFFGVEHTDPFVLKRRAETVISARHPLALVDSADERESRQANHQE